MATSLSTTMVYEWFCEKKALADLLEISPDEFHPWVKEQWTAVQNDYDKLLASLTEVVNQYKDLPQKDFALAIKDHPNKGILFSVRSGKDLFGQICKQIKPASDDKLQWTENKDTKTETEKVQKAPQIITLMIGISGSGKSTWAKQQLITQPNTVIVSRDAIREQIFGYDPTTVSRYYEQPNLAKKEELVTQVEQSQIEAAMALGYDVIVDDTNLTQKVIRGFFAKFPQAIFLYKVCECDVEEAIARCNVRARKVSADVIRAQNTKLKALLPNLEELFSQQVQPIIQDSAKPSAVIVDLDGTLALFGSRNPYDWTRVEEDTLNRPVYTTMKALQNCNHTILLCSGRSEEGREGTERWLQKNGITYASLHMRPKDDSRPDYIVKEEMWRHLVKSYHIEYMLDDRNSVVNHARSLGFTVFQVAPGNF
jgi:predicted kinase